MMSDKARPPSLTEIVAEFGAGLRFEHLPDAITQDIKARVLDILGICIAATDLSSSQSVRNYVIQSGASGGATGIGVGARLSAENAAFINGVLAHSLDYDDTHLPSILHPSASVVPAVLAAAEEDGANGKQVITAIAFGLEVCIRLGMAGYDREKGNSTFFEYGQHATSICGAMGAAAAVASLRGNAATIVNSMGVAASMASGIIESNRTGGNVKRIHCGWAAKSAIAAVNLVNLGITGPPTVLEGRFGFFQAWLKGAYDPAEIIEGLGERWSMADIFYKPYPANHFTHAAIDAGARLRRRGIAASDISRLTLGVPTAAKRTIGEPIEIKRAPDTGYMAQFSAPYAVVAGFLGGSGLEVGLDDYTDELARDPRRRELMSKVDVVTDPRCNKIFPAQFPAILTAELNDGTTITEEVLSNRGGNLNPLSFDELASKFDDNALRKITPAQARGVRGSCERLDELTRVADLFAELTELNER